MADNTEKNSEEKAVKYWRYAAMCSGVIFLLLGLVLAVLFFAFAAVYFLSNSASWEVRAGAIVICLVGICLIAIGGFVFAAMYSEGKAKPEMNRENALDIAKFCSVLVTAIGAAAAVLMIVMSN